MASFRPVAPLRLLVVALLLAAAPAGATGLAKQGVPPEGRLEFTVRKSGAEIGQHRISFSADGGDLVVDTEASLRVRFAFVTVYRYAQRTREVWRGGTLVSLESEIDDNGQPFKISAERRDGRLLVNGHEGAHEHDPGLFPLSYWNPELMRQRLGIDIQWGSLTELDVTERGTERRSIRGAETDVQRFNMKGTEIRSGQRQAKPWLDVDAWYSPEGVLLGMSFHYRGHEFDYVLR